MSLLAQLNRSPEAGEPKDEGAAQQIEAKRREEQLRRQDDDDDRAVLRVSNGALDLSDPEVARDEAAEILASRAEGPVPAAIGRGLFDEHYGAGALERLMSESGLTVTRTRKQGLGFQFDLVGRDPQGQPDMGGSAIQVHDAGTNVQVKQKPPAPEMIALALVHVARLKNWPCINIESHGPLANEVRKHVKLMGMDVVELGGAAPRGAAAESRRSQSLGMG